MSWKTKMLRGFVTLVLSSFALVANAQERILSFHTDIAIDGDASMRVTESISVESQGIDIRRGIFRDFITRYEDRLGNNYRVNLRILSVTRDGRSEPWRREGIGNGTRVYIGAADSFLPPARYDYEINYVIDRMIGYYDDRDELYWNVTGNEWGFAIEAASAEVRLPAATPIVGLRIEGFTGARGEAGTDYAASIDVGSAAIESTRVLLPGEGLTLRFSFPKAVVYEPSQAQKFLSVLADNAGLLLNLLVFLGSAVFLYLMWSRHGRDPKPGVIFPLYEPPLGYSPASARYISRMGYDNATFTAALLNLAVKGYVEISKEKKKYTVGKLEGSAELAPGEQALLDALFAKFPTVELDAKHHDIFSKSKKAHKLALKTDYANYYFRTNSHYLIPTAVISVLTLIVTGVLDLVVATIAVPVVLNFFLHLFYLYLLRAPSRRGRMHMDKLEGFKMYLEIAEQEDLALRNPPEKTPQLFESYLPFALALGVEQAWAEQFNSVFEKIANTTGKAYRPYWYHGTFHHANIASFSTDVGSALTAAVSTAAVAPGSAGAGGAGGGGGGGGGGGW